MRFALFVAMFFLVGCLPEQSYPSTPYNSGGALSTSAYTSAPELSANPSGTTVPTPEREERYPNFDSFANVYGINGRGWHCLTFLLSGGTTYSSCSRQSSLCEAKRSTFVDRGEDVSQCSAAAEAWCFALTDGIRGNRMAMCSLTYDGCATSRDVMVRGNRSSLYPHRNITRCRAFN